MRKIPSPQKYCLNISHQIKLFISDCYMHTFAQLAYQRCIAQNQNIEQVIKTAIESCNQASWGECFNSLFFCKETKVSATRSPHSKPTTTAPLDHALVANTPCTAQALAERASQKANSIRRMAGLNTRMKTHKK